MDASDAEIEDELIPPSKVKLRQFWALKYFFKIYWYIEIHHKNIYLGLNWKCIMCLTKN